MQHIGEPEACTVCIENIMENSHMVTHPNTSTLPPLSGQGHSIPLRHSILGMGVPLDQQRMGTAVGKLTVLGYEGGTAAWKLTALRTWLGMVRTTLQLPRFLCHGFYDKRVWFL